MTGAGAQGRTGRGRALGVAAAALAALALAGWLFSYSWMLGGIIPMDALVRARPSPWLLGELAAIPLGAVAALLAALAWRSGRKRRGVAVSGWIGAVVALLSVLSVLSMPAS